MKKYFRFLGLLCASLGILSIAHAQTPLDGLMMPKGEICIALQYEQVTWDRYWEGSTIRVNQNIGTFTRQMGMPMIVIVGRGVANGVLEVRDRIAGTTTEVPIAQAAQHIITCCA